MTDCNLLGEHYKSDVSYKLQWNLLARIWETINCHSSCDKKKIDLKAVVSLSKLFQEGYYYMIRKIRKDMIFFIISISCLIYTITNCLLTRGDILPGGDDVFMDFFNHINYVTVAKNVYFTNQHACFPPFSYLFYTFLNLLLPVGATSFHNAAGTTGRAYFIYAIYLVVLFISLAEVIHRYLKSNYSRNSVFGLTILISLSYCFANGVIERGNASLIVLLLLLVSIHLKDSENPVCRELSLLFIAFAAGFKVYPAIWGLQYIKEKRYKEAFRLLIYGVVVFFLPFAFFGGLAGVRQFIINQSLVQNGLDSDISLYSMLSGIIANQSIVNAAWIVLCLLLFVIYFASNTSFQQYIMLSMIMIIAPKWSGSYMVAQTIYQLHTAYKPKIWRRVLVSHTINLSRLAHMLMTLYEMEGSHLFNFYSQDNGILRSKKR